jgi:hypothetical protein
MKGKTFAAQGFLAAEQVNRSVGVKTGSKSPWLQTRKGRKEASKKEGEKNLLSYFTS